MSTDQADHDEMIRMENFREQLMEQRQVDFMDSLKNPNEIEAERYQLIGMSSKCLERLQVIEKALLKDYLDENDESICPSCLTEFVVDFERIQNVVVAFNHYLDASQDLEEDVDN